MIEEKKRSEIKNIEGEKEIVLGSKTNLVRFGKIPHLVQTDSQ